MKYLTRFLTAAAIVCVASHAYGQVEKAQTIRPDIAETLPNMAAVPMVDSGRTGRDVLRKVHMFVEALGGTNSDGIYSVVEMSDGGVAAVGYTYSYGAGEKDVLLIRFDRCGDVLWARAVGGEASEEGRDIIETYDGGLAFTGYTNSIGGGDGNLLLAKFDSDGNLTWATVVRRPDTPPVGVLNFYGYSVIEDTDHDLVVAGYMHQSEALVRDDLLLAGFEEDGTYTLTRAVYNLAHTLWDHYGYGIVELCGEDGYLVVGRAKESGDETILLVKFRDNTTVDWGWWYEDPADVDPERALDVTRMSDCGVVITGETNDHLVLFKELHDPPWFEIITEQSTEGHAVIETEDGGIVVTGTLDDGSRDLLLAKWDGAGHHQWTKSYGGSGTEYGHSVIEYPHDPNGPDGLWALGRTTSYGAGGFDAFLVAGDANGDTCLPDNGGPPSHEWHPDDGQYVAITFWEPSGIQDIGWAPDVTNVDPNVEIVCKTPAIITVCPDGSADFETIQPAIDNACNGDIVELCDAVYSGPGNVNLDFHGKAITVRSQSGDPEACVIACVGPQLLERGFYFHSGEGYGSVVERIKITNGFAGVFPASGGAIFCSNASSPCIRNCVIAGNGTGFAYGGGIACSDGSSPTIETCVISGNSAAIDGGGIHCFGGSAPTIEACVISGNSADTDGGGIYADDADVPVLHCTVSGNRAGNDGGGLYGPCLPKWSIVWGNCADSGAGDQWYGNGHDLPVNCCNDLGYGLDGFGGITTCGLGVDFSYEPMFCDPEPCENAPTTGGDYHLCFESPCTAEAYPECGLIGALDVDCGCYADIAKPQEPGEKEGCDGTVGINDFLKLLGDWGPCPEPCPPYCASDLTHDCFVGIQDFLELLGAWGPCIPINPACVDATGPCNVPNATPGCDDPECCTLVCQLAPECCVFEWSQACATIAIDLGCAPPPSP
jgi:predicted outer membrane repeat protein